MSLPPASATTQPIQSHSGYMTPEILLPAYRSASTRILLFDYDGTLTPIIATPSLATLPPLAATLLASLANHPQNTVWVVSGRDRAFLDLHVGHLSPSLGLCAEHGAFLRPPRSTAWQDLSVGEDLSWKPVIERLFEETARDLEGSGVERKQAAVVWHYRQARDMELARDRARRVAVDLKALAARREWVIAVVEGKCVVEVRPGRLGKGGIVERLLGEMVVGDEAVFVMAVGDDTTDEGELTYRGG